MIQVISALYGDDNDRYGNNGVRLVWSNYILQGNEVLFPVVDDRHERRDGICPSKRGWGRSKYAR